MILGWIQMVSITPQGSYLYEIAFYNKQASSYSDTASKNDQ
jgi:hypothetical protein